LGECAVTKIAICDAFVVLHAHQNKPKKFNTLPKQKKNVQLEKFLDKQSWATFSEYFQKEDRSQIFFSSRNLVLGWNPV
jgi:hypothetical protein